MPAEKLAIPTREHWVPIDRAAALTGLSESVWRRRGVGLQAKGLAALLTPPSGKGKPVWWFDPRADPKLSYRRGQSSHSAETRALSGRFPAHLVEKAALRLRYLQMYRTARQTCSAATAARQVTRQARQCQGSSFKISPRSLQVWDRNHRVGGVDALVDGYASSCDRNGRSPQAVDLFYSLYHTPQRLTVQQCHDIVLRDSKRHNWLWAESVTATREWLKTHDDLELTTLLRQGSAAYQHQAMAHIEQDYSGLAPGEQFVCDHHQLKTFCLYRHKAIRPWLTAVMDARTRVVVGWHLGPSPHSDAILQSLRKAFLDWGVPRSVKIDNGRDFAAKVFSGLTKSQIRRLKREFGSDWKQRLRAERDRVDCVEKWFGLLPELGCEIVYALPYSPWSKLIERWFRTAVDQHFRGRAAFCDTSPDRKPEGLKAIVADVEGLPTLDDERKALGEYIDIYHATAHLGDAMNGRSPRQVWAAMTSVVRTAPADSLNLLMNIVGEYKVGKNGVTVTVAGSSRGYGQYSGVLRARMGRTVLVAVDRDHLEEAVILTPDRDSRKVICKVPANDRVSPAADAQEMREAQQKINRSRKAMHRAKASAPDRQRTASEIVAADRRQQAAELRATGTHGKPPRGADQPIKLLQTGIDAPSMALQGPLEPGPEPAYSADLFGDEPVLPRPQGFDPAALLENDEDLFQQEQASTVAADLFQNEPEFETTDTEVPGDSELFGDTDPDVHVDEEPTTEDLL